MGNCGSKTDGNDKVKLNGHDTSQSSGSSSGNSDKVESQISAQRCNEPLRGSNYNQKPSSNEDEIYSTKSEVNSLLCRIHEFQGTSENDKNYRYLDEMLTRCILKLDKIECNNSTDRGNRKEAIRGVNQAISILERKLEINSDIKKLECNLSNSPEQNHHIK